MMGNIAVSEGSEFTHFCGFDGEKWVTSANTVLIFDILSHPTESFYVKNADVYSTSPAV